MCLLWLLICFVFLLLFLPSLFFPLLVFFGKSSLENGWQGINVIVAILVLIATGFAAYAAFQSYRTTRRIAQVGLYYQRQAIYSSGEMLEALGLMEELSLNRDQDKDAFIKAVLRYRNRESVETIWKRKNEKGKDIQRISHINRYETVKRSRRQVSNFFLTSFEMVMNKDLDKASFQKICAYGSFKFLYHVVEWLELADAYAWKYDRDTFTKLLYQSGRPRNEIKELEKLRPPKTWAEVEQMIQPNQPQQ